ncbi:12004_t:CDS:2 [Rhizophagus irregularis]|nr:12004_t:CDS:2 [Rhizophagus irregularis]
MVALCNIFDFDYFNVFNFQTLIELNESNVEKISEYTNAYDAKQAFKLKKEVNESVSKRYISQHIPVVITLGIFQVIFIVFCLLLLKMRSWRCINKSKLNGKKKNVNIIFQLEESLFLTTFSYLGIWLSEIYFIYSGQLGGVFNEFGVTIELLDVIAIIPICTVFIAIQKRSKFLFCLFYFASILKASFIIGWLYEYNRFLKTLIGDIKGLAIPSQKVMNIMFYRELAIVGKEPNSDLRMLGANEWKFEPRSEISILEIVSINIDDNDNKSDDVIDIENEKNISKSVEISFNAESDVMIQTKYPLPNSFKKDTSSVTLSPSLPIEYYYYEITILSNQDIDETIIAIGLAPKNHSIYRLPGCDTHSVGFHSDEGRTFHNEGYTGSKYAEKWGKVNDVIGCGFCPSTGQVFFTMNGNHLGFAYTGLFHTWYPTIGSNGVCSLKVNFGQEEFTYKEANDMNIADLISCF